MGYKYLPKKNGKIKKIENEYKGRIDIKTRKSSVVGKCRTVLTTARIQLLVADPKD